MQRRNYDPYALRHRRRRAVRRRLRGHRFPADRAAGDDRQDARLQAQVEELDDRNWELREAEERAHSLLEAQGDLIVRRDANGLITYANDAFCALAGRSRDELIGKAVCAAGARAKRGQRARRRHAHA